MGTKGKAERDKGGEGQVTGPIRHQGDLSKQVRFQQRPEGGAGGSRADTHGRPFQTEGKAGAKALRQGPRQVIGGAGKRHMWLEEAAGGD